MRLKRRKRSFRLRQPNDPLIFGENESSSRLGFFNMRSNGQVAFCLLSPCINDRVNHKN